MNCSRTVTSTILLSNQNRGGGAGDRGRGWCTKEPGLHSLWSALVQLKDQISRLILRGGWSRWIFSLSDTQTPPHGFPSNISERTGQHETIRFKYISNTFQPEIIGHFLSALRHGSGTPTLTNNRND